MSRFFHTQHKLAKTHEDGDPDYSPTSQAEISHAEIPQKSRAGESAVQHIGNAQWVRDSLLNFLASMFSPCAHNHNLIKDMVADLEIMVPLSTFLFGITYDTSSGRSAAYC